MTFFSTDTNTLEDLAQDPPPKSPYFTLPDVINIQVPTRSKKRTRRRFASIVLIWGLVEKMTDSSAAGFLLDMLAFSDCKIDFDGMARHWDLKSSTHLKNRLARICEDRGFAFQVVSDDDSATSFEPESTTLKRASKRKTTNVTASSAPKRLKLVVSKKSVDVEEQRQKEVTVTTSAAATVRSSNKTPLEKKSTTRTKSTRKHNKLKEGNEPAPGAV